jgi:hypothetical protein
MKKPRIHIDTSVICGCFDDEFSECALATVGEVDLLVSWNFKHIVHFDKIRLFSSVNLELGTGRCRSTLHGRSRAAKENRPMQELKIKAVEMVRGIREAHYASLKDLSPEEKIAFFREKARALHAELGRPEEGPEPTAQPARFGRR